MKQIWSKLPSRWIVEESLPAFQTRRAGADAAALKLYMAIAFSANFNPSAAGEPAGGATLSFSELETLCDISRRYVSLGLTRLTQQGLVTTHLVGNRHRYQLSHYDDVGWAKLPRSHLLDDGRFQGLGIRGAQYLNALKLYLVLATFRPNNSAHVPLSYNTIQKYTGMLRPHIRRTIDVLLNHDWISMVAVDPGPSHEKPVSVYLLRGDFWGRKPRTYASAVLSAGA